jgi:hypothetical protein
MAKSKSNSKKPGDDEDPQMKDRDEADDADAEEATELDANVEEAPEADADDSAEVETELEAKSDDEEAAESEETEEAAEEEEEQVKADDEGETADEDTEAVEEEAEAGDGDEGGDDEDEEDSVDETPPALTPKLTKTTTALIFLNWTIAPVFLFIAYLDLQVRAQYTHRTQLNYIQIYGLPLKGEEDTGSFHTLARPRLRLTSDQLQEGVKKRLTKSYKDFVAYEEPLPLAVVVRESDMTDRLKNDVFGGLTPTVSTLDDEIERLKTSVPTAIKAKAEEVVRELEKKSDGEKRAVAAATLMTMAWNTKQVDALAARFSAAKGSELDLLVNEAVQRRLYYDILAPLNVYRSGEVDNLNNYRIERICETDKYKLADVESLFAERLTAAIADEFKADTHLGEKWAKERQPASVKSADGKDLHSMTRTSMDKRQAIGFIMFALSQVRVAPLEKKVDNKIEPHYLIDKGLERAQVVCGFSEATSAMIRYPFTVAVLQERQAQAIRAERDGYLHALKGGQPTDLTVTIGFARLHDNEVDRLVKIVEHIDFATKRLSDLNGQRKEYQRIFDERKKQHEDALDKLLAARTATERSAKELREYQDQLQTALVELSEAGDRNLQLYQQIYDIETEMMRKKAPKKGGQP